MYKKVLERLDALKKRGVLGYFEKEAVNVAMIAVRKQIPCRPCIDERRTRVEIEENGETVSVDETQSVRCGHCNFEIGIIHLGDKGHVGALYCPNCGQRSGWAR